MKNKRFLLHVFIILIIPTSFYLPLNYKLNPLHEELDYIMDKYAVMSEIFETENNIIAKKTEHLAKINELNFNNELSQEKIITILRDCTGKNNIQISNIKFSEGSNSYSGAAAEITETGSTEDRCEFLSVSVEFKLEFEDLLSFVDDMREYGKDISITGIRVVSWEEDMLYSVVDMKFYAVTSRVEI